jgi:hypothetical protein
MNKTLSNFLVGFLAGAAAGAIAGILFAPDKGSATRQNIRRKVRDISDDFGLGIGELMDEMGVAPEPFTEPVTRARRRKPNHPPDPSANTPAKQPMTNNQRLTTNDYGNRQHFLAIQAAF